MLCLQNYFAILLTQMLSIVVVISASFVSSMPLSTSCPRIICFVFVFFQAEALIVSISFATFLFVVGNLGGEKMVTGTGSSGADGGRE